MEVYVDDVIIKSKKASDHIALLTQTFDQLEKRHMKLNLTKCVFEIWEAMFLGFIINRREIEGNPVKIKALIGMQTPKTIKDVQSLT